MNRIGRRGAAGCEIFFYFSYMLKRPSLLPKGFIKNKKTQEKLFKHMCNFGAREEWRNGRRDVSSYLDVEISKNQYRLVNSTTLECISGYITKGAIGERAFKILTKQRPKIIYGYISSYCYIINYPKRLHMIKQANNLASVLCDIEYDRLGEKLDRKKRAMDAEDQRNYKSEKIRLGVMTRG